MLLYTRNHDNKSGIRIEDVNGEVQFYIWPPNTNGTVQCPSCFNKCRTTCLLGNSVNPYPTTPQDAPTSDDNNSYLAWLLPIAIGPAVVVGAILAGVLGARAARLNRQKAALRSVNLQATARSAPPPVVSTPPLAPVLKPSTTLYVVNCSVNAVQEGDIALPKGAVVEVIDRGDAVYWIVKYGEEKGLVPAAFLIPYYQ